MSVVRIDPAKIPVVCKEAFADALINTIGTRLRGGDESSRILYRAKPSDQLTSGYLVPLGEPESQDEVTSPIRIGSHGLDFQVTRGVKGLVRVSPTASLYIRLLLTKADLRRDDCAVAFVLQTRVIRERREAISRLRSEWWNREKGSLQRMSDHPDWEKRRKEFQSAADSIVGIPAGVDVEINESTPASEATEDGELPIERARPQGADMPDSLVKGEDIPHKWYRLSLRLPTLEFNPYAEASEISAQVELANVELQTAISAQLEEWARSDADEFGGRLWGYRDRIKLFPSDLKSWDSFVTRIRQEQPSPAMPSPMVRWDVTAFPDWLDESRINIHIALENRSEVRPPAAIDNSIFNVSLSVDCDAAMHAPLRLGRVEPSYRYNRFLRYPALGLNAGVVASTTSGNLKLQTTWTPRYVQPRIRPPPSSKVELNISRLAQPSGLEGIKEVAEELRAWTRERVASIDPRSGLGQEDRAGAEREAGALHRDSELWESEARAIQAGVDLLLHSASVWKERGPNQDARSAVFEAWLAMNETMARVAAEKGYSEWRLFQIAFVLTNIPAIATREQALAADFFDERRDEAVTLLYFATGGGKSEAFLGLLCFSLFFDRLRGKRRGVTALLRYPLRLLTVQQAQRTARVLARAQSVKVERKYDGAEFGIGFWVGSSGSPNRLSQPEIRASIPTLSKCSAFEEDQLVATSPSYVIARQRWRKLPACPFCKSTVGLRRVTEERGPLAHLCTNRECASLKLGLRQLPFYIVDEDIYAIAPSVLVGTVDKLALLGHSAHTIRRILGMFGGASWQHKATERLFVPSPRELREGIDEEEFEQLAPSFPNGKHIFHDPFPSLIVQDEAHLLDESLGTFAGLFETTFEAMLDELARAIPKTIAWRPGVNSPKRRRAKIVAASATVARPERQLQHLYQREIPAVQFPYPGPDLYESFYATPVEPTSESRRKISRDLVETRAEHGRIYAALLTNGRPHTTTMVAVLAEFHVTISRWLHAMVSGSTADKQAAVSEMKEGVSEGLLQSEHRDALSKASDSELATLIDLHRIALTYVTNKKGGDQILAAENTQTAKRHIELGIALEGFKTELISGSVDQGKVGAVVDEAQRRALPGEQLDPLADSLRSIVATSAISHGVDIDELNTMFFAGLPSDIAEYIQASSRVGRTHVGFCMLVPTPQRRRDRYVVEVFDSFHRFLERMVQPAAIDRWAENAIRRAIPSIFQAYLCGVVPTTNLVQAEGDKKGVVSMNSYASEIAALYRRDRVAIVDKLYRFAENAIGLRAGFEPPGVDYYRHLLKEQLRDLLDGVSDRNVGAVDLRSFWEAERNSLRRPMTSLRDVDRAGLISYASERARQPTSDQVASVMRFVQGGVADADDLDEAGESE
jgi:hypothetical protein